MESPSSGRQRLTFGLFEVDLASRRLHKHGHLVHMPDQAFLVLKMLLERPREVVTREELRKELWPEGTFVDYNEGIDTAVKRARQALGESAQNPIFFETIPRLGYRFIAPVQIEGNGLERRDAKQTAPIPKIASPKTHAWKLVAGALACFLLLSGPLTLILSRRGRTVPAIRSIAVLPLENLSGDAAQDYFADGMTDELITNLGQISSLRVISRTSVMQYKGVHKPLPQIARELGVDSVVEGTVLRSGDSVRITAQLVEARTDQHLWAQSYRGELRDMLSLQSEVASAIASQIRINLTPQQQVALKRDRVADPEAEEAYLKGLYLVRKATIEVLPKGISYLKLANEKSPSGRAYAGLASAYVHLAGTLSVPPQETFPLAKSAALRALELDNGLEEGHRALGQVKFLYEWDFPGAEREFQLAIQLNPNSVEAQKDYAVFLSAMGRTDEAILHAQQGLQVDPLSLAAITEVARQFYRARRYDEAIALARRALELDPSYSPAHASLGLALEQKHEFPAAIAELEKATGLCPGKCVGLIGQVSALSGDKVAAHQAIRELQKRPYTSPWLVANIYAQLGDKEQAFRWLEKAYQIHEPDMVTAKIWPLYDGLRSDPRFQDLLRRMNFPS